MMSGLWAVAMADAHWIHTEIARQRGNRAQVCASRLKAVAAYEEVLSKTPERKGPRRFLTRSRELIADCPSR